MNNANRSYLVMAIMRRMSGRKLRSLIFGGFLTAVFGFGVIAGLMGDETLRQHLTMYTVFLIPSVLLFLRGFRIAHWNNLARRYDIIFAGDRDGFVSMEELIRQTGKPDQKIIGELNRLFDKGYFTDCTLEVVGNPGVRILDARIGEENRGFLDVFCPSCGGVNRLRAGSYGKCSFCGAPIQGKLQE